METQHAEKRKEPRFPVEPGSKLKLHCRGNFLRATAIDVSVSGILLECAGPIRLVPGDPVSCELDYGDQESFELRDASVGTVIRIHAPYIAVGFTGDLFSRLLP
jgi:hypothetical protein